MSKLTDFIFGGGLPYLDLSEAAPSIDLTTSIENGLNAQKGDKSCLVFASSGGSITLYNDAGSSVWAVTPANIAATMTHILSPGLYIPSTNTLHVVAFKNTANYDLVYCTINTLTGAITAGTKQASLVAAAQPLQSVDVGNSIYYMNGGTLLLFHRLTASNSATVVLSMNVSTKVITNVSATNQVPSGKVILGPVSLSNDALQRLYLHTNSTFLSYSAATTWISGYHPSSAGAFITFGDYVMFRNANFTITVAMFHLGYPKAAFYAAMNKILPAIFPGKTILEV
jgi:hypothetical protein